MVVVTERIWSKIEKQKLSDRKIILTRLSSIYNKETTHKQKPSYLEKKKTFQLPHRKWIIEAAAAFLLLPHLLE